MSTTNEEEQEKKALRKKMIEEEKKRKYFEKYSTGTITYGMIIPVIVTIIVLLYEAYLFFFDKVSFNENENTYYIYITIFLVVLFGIYGVSTDEFEKKLEIRKELFMNNQLKYNFDYNDTNFYTDSRIEYFLYWFFKLSYYLINVIAIFIIGFVLFSWLGTISIAPTTIIIILLIIIIANQGRKD